MFGMQDFVRGLASTRTFNVRTMSHKPGENTTILIVMHYVSDRETIVVA